MMRGMVKTTGMMTAISDRIASLSSAVRSAMGAVTLDLLIEGQPVAASRPRVGKWGTYYGKNYSKWIKDSWRYVDQISDVPSDLPVAVFIEAVFEQSKHSKISYPTPDVDNLAKGPLDQITKLAKDRERGIWTDDKHILLLSVSKRFCLPDEKPGFYIYWFPLE